MRRRRRYTDPLRPISDDTARDGMRAAEHLARVEIASRADLRAWLAANHLQDASVWLVTWKKPDARHLPYGDLVEELLAFGWVDSLPHTLDAARSMLLAARPRCGDLRRLPALDPARHPGMDQAGPPPGNPRRTHPTDRDPRRR